jgi:RNA polymerase sigma factor (sigma-70 family)
MQVLYARHHVRVCRFVIRLVRDESTAEDLISEVFLDVWRQAGRFEGRSAVSTWMLAIARFKALSALRRRPDEEFDEDNAATIRPRRWRKRTRVPSSRNAWLAYRRSTGKLSISSTTTTSPWKRSLRSLVSGEHGQNPHVLHAQEAGGAAQGRRN